jgi:hypothetical protein
MFFHALPLQTNGRRSYNQLVLASDRLNVGVESLRKRIIEFFDRLFGGQMSLGSIKIKGTTSVTYNSCFMKYMGCKFIVGAATNVKFDFNLMEENFHTPHSGLSLLEAILKEASVYYPILECNATTLKFSSDEEESKSSGNELTTEEPELSIIADGIQNRCRVADTMSKHDVDMMGEFMQSDSHHDDHCNYGAVHNNQQGDKCCEDNEEHFSDGWNFSIEDQSETTTKLVLSTANCTAGKAFTNVPVSAILPISATYSVAQNAMLLTQEMIDCMRLDLLSRSKIQAAAHAFADAVIRQQAEFSADRLVGIINIIGMYFYLIICKQLNYYVMANGEDCLSEAGKISLINNAFSGIMAGNLPSIRQMEHEVEEFRYKLTIARFFPHLPKQMVIKVRRECQATVRKSIECLFLGFRARLLNEYPPICSILCNVKVTEAVLEAAKVVLQSNDHADCQLKVLFNLATTLAKYNKQPTRWAYEEADQFRDYLKKRQSSEISKAVEAEEEMKGNVDDELLPEVKRMMCSSPAESSFFSSHSKGEPISAPSLRCTSSAGQKMNNDNIITDSYKIRNKTHNNASSTLSMRETEDEAAHSLLSLQDNHGGVDDEKLSDHLQVIVTSLEKVLQQKSKTASALSPDDGSTFKLNACPKVQSIYLRLKDLIRMIEQEYEVIINK